MRSPAHAHSNPAPPLSPANAGTVQSALSCFNMGLSVLMCASGVLGVSKSNGFSADIFVALYMILFGVLLFTYELMWWKTVDSVTRVLRKNFGFLFGIKGKSFFIIFIAFLNFGLNSAGEPAKTLGMATGICLLIDGMSYLTVPELQLVKVSMIVPSEPRGSVR